MKFATILQLIVVYLFNNHRMDSQLNCLSLQVVFTDIANITGTTTEWVDGGRQVATKQQVNATSTLETDKWLLLVPLLPPHNDTYYTKQLHTQPNLSVSCLVNYCQLSACQGEMEPFEDYPSICGCLISLRNKPQQKQPGQLSAQIPACIVS